MPPAPVRPFDLGNVRMDAKGLYGVQDGRCYLVIPHDQIVRVTLRRGSSSAHPLVQVIVGAALAASGIPVLLYLIYWINHGGTFLSYVALFLTFPVIGAFLLISAMRPCHYLLVERRSGRAKLPFSSTTSPQLIRNTLRDAQQGVDYPVEIDPLIAGRFGAQ